MADEQKCIICEAFFRPSAMVGTKCGSCNSLYPNAKTREDIKVTNKNRAQTLTDETVRVIVYEILEEANIKRAKCETCGKLFFRNSPAQKFCQVCRDKEQK